MKINTFQWICQNNKNVVKHPFNVKLFDMRFNYISFKSLMNLFIL